MVPIKSDLVAAVSALLTSYGTLLVLAQVDDIAEKKVEDEEEEED